MGNLPIRNAMATTAKLKPYCLLNNRRYTILLLWAVEFSVAQIADKLHLSYWCVDKEIRAIYKILGASTGPGAVHKAWLLGIFTKKGRKKKAKER